jgi:hypothetical protein
MTPSLGQPRSRSVRLERTRPGSIIVNRYGRRFANEATDYNSFGGAFHQFDPGSLRVSEPSGLDDLRSQAPARPTASSAYKHRRAGAGVVPSLRVTCVELAGRVRDRGRKGCRPPSSMESSGRGRFDPEFDRGVSAYDGWWGDQSRSRRSLQRRWDRSTARRSTRLKSTSAAPAPRADPVTDRERSGPRLRPSSDPRPLRRRQHDGRSDRHGLRRSRRDDRTGARLGASRGGFTPSARWWVRRR